ncbi:AAA family ATPase [Zavarzinia sp. CC-PAN008]|uniref:AAA family ATPase n=1 Tax=Zavarzinia sp. CC-PAN008 TaxID=3243332 RepID=UPI003F748E41
MNAPALHEMPKLEAALWWAARGVPVFPIAEGRKRPPAIEGWNARASTDPERVRALWCHWDPVFEMMREPDFNPGLAMGPNLMGLDVDVKDGKGGKDSIAKLVEAHGRDWLDTLSQVTPSGGLHFIFSTPHAVANSCEALGPGLDVRGFGGYLVGAGAETAAGRYELGADRPIAPAPAWLLEAVGPWREQPAQNVADYEPDEAHTIAAGRELLQCAPLAIQGAGGDATTYRVACDLKDLGLSEPMVLELMLDEWNGRCVPPWAPDELSVKVANAFAYGTSPPGIAHRNAPEDDFPPVPEADPPARIERPRIYLVPAWEVEPDPQHMPLIDDVLDREGFSADYGPSNVGKTFVALHRAWCIATGQPWHQYKTHQGAWAYVAAEGGRGIMKRVKALRMEPGCPERVPFGLIPCPIDLLHGHDDTNALLDLIQRFQDDVRMPVAGVTIDTLSRALGGGNENTSEDMGTLVKHLDQMRARMPVHINVVHHSGKDEAKGMRGWSGIRAAIDTETEISENRIEVTKQRDLEKTPAIGFRLRSVVVGHRSDGRPISSAVCDLFEPGGDVEVNAVEAGIRNTVWASLRKLNKEGARLSVKPGTLYAADKIKREGPCWGLTIQQIEDAVECLKAEGRVIVNTHGRGKHRRDWPEAVEVSATSAADFF